MKPTKLSEDQVFAVLKAAAYVGISAVLSYVLGIITETPDLLGVYTPIINVILVILKKIFTESEA